MSDAREIIAEEIGRYVVSPEIRANSVIAALRARGYTIIHRDENQGPTLERKFALGERVTKIKGSSWTGRVVGIYSTDLTPVGYCIESENEPGSVQIYPEAAIRALHAEEERR